MWALWARRYSQARKGRPCHRYRPMASQALRKTCSVRSSASGWLPARKYRYLYTRSTNRSYNSPNALGSRETTTRLTSATTLGSSGPSMDGDGSVPGTDNVFQSGCVMGVDAQGRQRASPCYSPSLAATPQCCEVSLKRYLRVSKYATILVASSSVSPTLGISVPGFRAGGFKIHFCRSSGPVLLTAPPAILMRL